MLLEPHSIATCLSSAVSCCEASASMGSLLSAALLLEPVMLAAIFASYLSALAPEVPVPASVRSAEGQLLGQSPSVTLSTSWRSARCLAWASSVVGRLCGHSCSSGIFGRGAACCSSVRAQGEAEGGDVTERERSPSMARNVLGCALTRSHSPPICWLPPLLLLFDH